MGNSFFYNCPDPVFQALPEIAKSLEAELSKIEERDPRSARICYRLLRGRSILAITAARTTPPESDGYFLWVSCRNPGLDLAKDLDKELRSRGASADSGS
jgi:hypothetical protein